jgi:hypothetical protein
METFGGRNGKARAVSSGGSSDVTNLPLNAKSAEPQCSAGVQIGLHIQAGITHLRQLVTQGARADTQALGSLLAPATLGPQGIDNYLELAAA